MSDYSSDTIPADSSGTAPVEGDDTRSESRGRAPNTLLNGLIGGVVAVLLSFLPFSTVLGGAVAGYLEGGDSSDGVRVGTIAGLVSFVPVVAFVGVMGLFVPVMGGGMGPEFGIWFVMLAVVLVGAVYTVGFSILGGVIGVYLKERV